MAGCVLQDEIGKESVFFPENDIIRVLSGVSVYKVTRSFMGNREMGQMALKKVQIVLRKLEKVNGSMKRNAGFFPADILQEI